MPAPMTAPTPRAVSWPAPRVRFRLCSPASPASASNMLIGFFTKSQLLGSLAPVASSSFGLVAMREAPRRARVAPSQIVYFTPRAWLPLRGVTKADTQELQSARLLDPGPPSGFGTEATRT